MDSIAEIVRRARKERGLTLDEVAASTRINRKYLEAIESGDRTAIPGGFFYKSFVRQYAAALATDSNKVVDEVDQVLDAEEPAVPAEQDDELLKAIAASAPAPERSGHRWVPSTFGYVILLILALIGSTGAYMCGIVRKNRKLPSEWRRQWSRRLLRRRRPRPKRLLQRPRRRRPRRPLPPNSRRRSSPRHLLTRRR